MSAGSRRLSFLGVGVAPVLIVSALVGSAAVFGMCGSIAILDKPPPSRRNAWDKTNMNQEDAGTWINLESLAP